MSYPPQFRAMPPAAMPVPMHQAIMPPPMHYPAWQQMPPMHYLAQQYRACMLPLPPNAYNTQSPMPAYAAQSCPMHAPCFPGAVPCSAPPAMGCYANPMLPTMPHYGNCGQACGAYGAGIRPSAGYPDKESQHQDQDNELYDWMINNVKIDDIIAQKIIKDFNLKTKSDLYAVSKEKGTYFGYTEKQQEALAKLTSLVRLEARMQYLNRMQ